MKIREVGGMIAKCTFPGRGDAVFFHLDNHDFLKTEASRADGEFYESGLA